MHALLHTGILYTFHSRCERDYKMRKETENEQNCTQTTCIWCLVVFRVWREYEKPMANRQTDQRNLFNISKTGYC